MHLWRNPRLALERNNCKEQGRQKRNSGNRNGAQEKKKYQEAWRKGTQEGSLGYVPFVWSSKMYMLGDPPRIQH